MVRLTSSRSGWSSVRDPETDEYVSLDDDVDDEVAERLTDRYDPVTRADEADTAEEEDEEEEEGEEEEFDATEFVDRTPMDDVVEDVENGEADDHLDAVEDAAEREGVQDAVEARRDELGEEGE